MTRLSEIFARKLAVHTCRNLLVLTAQQHIDPTYHIMTSLDPTSIFALTRARERPQAAVVRPTTRASDVDNINLQDAPRDRAELLPLVTSDDDLERTVELMTEYAKVVGRGGSLAIWTGYQASGSKTDDPVEYAYGGMNERERKWFDYWTAQAAPEEFDFAKYRKRPSEGLGKRDTLREWVTALNAAYGRKDLDEEDYAGWRGQNEEMFPLLSAYKRVVHAANAVLAGFKNMSVLQAQEYQSLTSLRGTAESNINRIQKEMNRLLKEAQDAKEVLTAREHALKKLLGGKVPEKESRLNMERRRMGIKPIGLDMDRHDGPARETRKRGREIAMTDLDELAKRVRKEGRETEAPGDAPMTGAGASS
uniref:Uncharacterized protein n=1 Tax=Rhizoctonia cerealis orthocurvulavirus TaxID=3068670 RepID=A0AA51GGS5_9VIRU|nr:MAG: hypothetical protein [Rhizoctonia cerealis orthocurvulavirus]